MSITEKIRKLVRHAESASGPEAETFLARASALAREYHLDIAEVSREEEEDALGGRASDIAVGGWRVNAEKWQLAWAVAEAFGCIPWTVNRWRIPLREGAYALEEIATYIWREERPAGSTVEIVETKGGERELEVTCSVYAHSRYRISLALHAGHSLGEYHSERSVKCTRTLSMVGRREMADAALYVYRQLLADMETSAKLHAKGRGRVAYRSFRTGVISGIRRRLAAEQQKAIDAAGGDQVAQNSAMVLVKAQEEAQAWLTDSLGKSPFSEAKETAKRWDASMVRAGRLAAENFEIADPNDLRSSAAARAGRVLQA